MLIICFFTISRLLSNRIRFDVSIQSVTRNASKLVLRAFKTARGPVRIKADAPCLVQRPAIVSHAQIAVPKPYLAAISVLVSAARFVRYKFVKPAPISKIRGSI